jgi:serine/threonine-protein phosphatase 2A regulatory subunit A
MPLLGRQLGSDFFDTELTTLCIKWLADPVFSIREAAAANLHKLADVFGPAWAEAIIIPRILTAPDDGNYLLRLTTLQAEVVR